MTDKKLYIDKTLGWPSPELRLNPNYNTRPEDVDGIVIHAAGLNIEDGNGKVWHAPDFIEQAGYSYHAMIEPTGKVIVTVESHNRAWHAGKSRFGKQEDLNDTFIGFCLLVHHQPLGWQGFTDALKSRNSFTDEHYRSLAFLCRIAMKDYPKITTDRIVGHSDVSGLDVRPDPKPDPGSGFDMNRLKDEIRGTQNE